MLRQTTRYCVEKTKRLFSIIVKRWDGRQAAAEMVMNTTPGACLTGFCWEHHTLSISSEVITDANPSRSGVL